MNDIGPDISYEQRYGLLIPVLIADDLRSHRELMRFTLEGCGYEVSEAEDGEQVIAIAATFEPLIFILDLRMPKVNGYQAAAALRAMPMFEKTPIIALTSSSRCEGRGEFDDVGFCEYLVKPVGQARLRECVAAFV